MPFNLKHQVLRAIVDQGLQELCHIADVSEAKNNLIILHKTRIGFAIYNSYFLWDHQGRYI